jgi:hypothetical protein
VRSRRIARELCRRRHVALVGNGATFVLVVGRASFVWKALEAIVTVATAQEFLGRSAQAVNEAIAVLAEKGVLHPITLAKRNRPWEARDLFDLINDVERELATPTDTEAPTRPSPRPRTVPRRR